MINQLLLLERRTRAQPHDPEVWCDLAEALLAEGQRADALEATESASQSRIRSAAQWVRVGDLFGALGIRDTAREMYEEACRREATSILALHRMGKSLLSDGDATNAADLFATGLWLDPANHGVRVSLIEALVVLSAENEALEHAHILVQSAPNLTEGWRLLAEVYLLSGDTNQAIGALRRGFSLDASERRTALKLSRLLLEAGFVSDAQGILQSCARTSPNDTELLLLLAETATRSGDAATATVTLRDLADRTLPPATRARLGGLLREAGHPQEALTVLREAVISAPEEPELYLELATTQLSLGRHGQAAAVVAKGLMMAPDDARLRSLLAEAGEHAVVAAPPIAPHDSVELASRPPEQTTEAPAGSSAFSGNLRQFSVVEMLEFLRMNRRTGVLRLVSDGRVAEVHLVDGHLAGGTIAGNARLGKMLLTNGMVAPEALQRAVELQRSLPRPLPLGQVLLSNDFITAESLRPALVDQIKMTLLEIIDWTEGTIVFDADDEMVHGLNADPLLLDTTTLMMETMRLRDEAAR